MLISVLLIIIAVMVIVFLIQNALPVTVTLLAWHFDASLAVVVILSVLVGMVIMALLFILAGAKKFFQKKKVSS
jgi:putative membrane protein